MLRLFILSSAVRFRHLFVERSNPTSPRSVLTNATVDLTRIRTSQVFEIAAFAARGWREVRYAFLLGSHHYDDRLAVHCL
jgi:hypothetical protein